MASSRFQPSNLHQRDPRGALFSNYPNAHTSRPSPSPSKTGGANGGYGMSSGGEDMNGGFRPATPNKRGQYSDAVLSELESQNDGHVEGITAKVKMLKDISMAIGTEIRDSSALVEKMNDSFDNTRVRLKGTMNRMLRMAERTGVGWRVWLLFFAAVGFLFWYVWLF